MRDLLKHFHLRSLFQAIALMAFLGGCASQQSAVYEAEEFHSTNEFSHDYATDATAACEAARRALLSQGYLISAAKTDSVDGHKSFQPDAENHVEIEFHVVCANTGKEPRRTTAFVNALQDRYALKKNSTSASVGVGMIGAVSLPFGASNDSLVKVASETIPSGDFYDRFFALMEHYLEDGGSYLPPEATTIDKPPGEALH